eukprot:scaffold171694_cov24-Tisochrysis_lutea.AAC.1
MYHVPCTPPPSLVQVEFFLVRSSRRCLLAGLPVQSWTSGPWQVLVTADCANQSRERLKDVADFRAAGVPCGGP